MSVTMNYPSPTSLGIGCLVMDNGDEAAAAVHVPPPILPPAVPLTKRNVAVGIPKTPTLSVENGAPFKQVLIREGARGLQVE